MDIVVEDGIKTYNDFMKESDDLEGSCEYLRSSLERSIISLPLTRDIVKDFNQQYRSQHIDFQIRLPKKRKGDFSRCNVVPGIEFFPAKILSYKSDDRVEWKSYFLAPGSHAALAYQSWFDHCFITVHYNVNKYRIGKPWINPHGRVSWVYNYNNSNRRRGENSEKLKHMVFFLRHPEALGIHVLPQVAHINVNNLWPKKTKQKKKCMLNRNTIDKMLPYGFKKFPNGISIALPIEFDKLSLAEAIVSRYVSTIDDYHNLCTLYEKSFLI